jgi:hypothetical protein
VDGHANPVGGSFNVPVVYVRIPQRHGCIAVAEEPGHDWDRHALEQGLACERVPAVVQSHVLKPGPAPDQRPEREFVAAGLRVVVRRGKHEEAGPACLTRQQPLRFGIEIHHTETCLGIGWID